MRSHSYLNSAIKIIDSYDGSIPLAAWLKDHFRVNKKFGSKDRKEVSHLCYCFFRMGKSFAMRSKEERLLIGLFLCSENPNLVLQELRTDWNEVVTATLQDKLQLVGGLDEVKNIFPFLDFLGKEVNGDMFSLSHLIQPSLFLRIRPGAKARVLHALDNAGISYISENNCVRLPNGTKAETLVSIDRDAVVQDYNSQRTLDQFKLLNQGNLNSAWDCCAASGGKSILLHDLFPAIHITVSDIRETILANLRKRFSVAGISNYDDFVADVSSPKFSMNKNFNLVICDAPCSGSGTWGRTPEQLSIFSNEKIEYYSSLQKKISTNAAKYLNKGGVFIYITCSVFSAENEDVVEYIKAETGLHLVSQQYLKGYDRKADTLFVATFNL